MGEATNYGGGQTSPKEAVSSGSHSGPVRVKFRSDQGPKLDPERFPCFSSALFPSCPVSLFPSFFLTRPGGMREAIRRPPRGARRVKSPGKIS